MALLVSFYLFVKTLLKHIIKAKKDSVNGHFPILNLENSLAWMSNELHSTLNLNLHISMKLWVFKYGVSIAGGCMALLLCQKCPAKLYPFIFSGGFYLLEAPLLFLIPVSLTQQKGILKKSLVLFYSFGVFRTFSTTLFLAAYMVIGIFRLQHPLKNWYVGCKALCLLYEELTKK